MSIDIEMLVRAMRGAEGTIKATSLTEEVTISLCNGRAMVEAKSRLVKRKPFPGRDYDQAVAYSIPQVAAAAMRPR